MKKIDKLVLQSFLGPFLLTFIVVVFILLTQHLMKYFEEFVGKNLGAGVFLELIFYFSVNMTQVALPLAVLLSSLMTFGNLGEHFELTAIKASGISLIRTMRSIFVFVCFLTVAAFFSNNYIIPDVNLKAYSLLYDIKQKKPALDIKEGAFYGGIPDYSIKVNKKLPDGESLEDLIIYDHTAKRGNTDLIIAESGKMYTFNNERYMMMELYNGKNYSLSEGTAGSKGVRRTPNPTVIEPFMRSEFDTSKIVFNLSSFDMQRTKEEAFANHRLMKNIDKLRHDADSMKYNYLHTEKSIYDDYKKRWAYGNRDRFSPPDQLLIAIDSLHRIRNASKLTPDSVKQKLDDPLANQKNERKKQDPVVIDDLVTSSFETLDSTSNKNNTNRNTPPSPYVGKTENTKDDDDSLKTNEPKKVASHNANELTRKDDSSSVDQKRKINLDSSIAVGTGIDSLNLDSIPPARIFVRGVDSLHVLHFDSTILDLKNRQRAATLALGQARTTGRDIANKYTRKDTLSKEINRHILEISKKYAMAVSCLIMFLIGAPLGAIIKKGGLGIPVLISIVFFIVFYVLTIMGEKWAKEGLLDPVFSIWIANIFLLPFGIFFLIQARRDARVFDTDIYIIFYDKMKKKFFSKK
ncbi:MAG: LptF/LptG family permease [Cyclobacteriaceae bacterium]|nr:LptF/LptG family permease [Cyclobacteriaceae bacterium]MCH8517912.1 LptF/LptG family permease [Cyclobacteriaceae bacterium]